jgi:hypothetical protein
MGQLSGANEECPIPHRHIGIARISPRIRMQCGNAH